MSLTAIGYRWFIDPLLSSIRRSIRNQITPGSSCVDVACGTGALVFSLMDHCSALTGIDLAEARIKTAQRKVALKGLDHLSFQVQDATNLSEFQDGHFDYATFSMAIHQFDPDIRKRVLTEAKRVSKTILIADYSWPLPANRYGKLARFLEWLAGKDHNRNYKDYDQNGGLEPFLTSMNLKFEKVSVHGKGIISIYAAK